MQRRPPTPWTAFEIASRAFKWLVEGLNALGTLWILGLMLLICADVVGRAFLGNPIAGVPEIVSLSIVGIVFLQLASTLRAGRMTRSDMLLNLLGRRARPVGHAVEVIFHLAGAFIMYVIFTASYPRFFTALERGEFVGAVGHFTAPTWPIKLILLIGSAALLIQFVFGAIRHAAYVARPSLAQQTTGAPTTADGARGEDEVDHDNHEDRA